MTPMRVSVLLACWNAERYVGDALRSVLAQVPPPIEVMAVDDGSTDGSAAVIAGFAPRVTLLRQANAGVAAALNLAAAHATGDVLAFIDADDLWLPGKLAVQGAALDADANLDGVFGHLQQFASADLPAAEQARVTVDQSQPALTKLSLLLRRRAFDRFGGFDERRRNADFVAWYAHASSLGFRWTMLPDVVCRRRLHAGNMGRVSRTRQHEDYLLTMKDFLDRRRAQGDRRA